MSIERDLLEYIGKQLARAGVVIEAETNLATAIDSTAMMELVVWIGDHYGFEVEIDDITPDHFGSVKKLTEYIESKKRG
ncbi:MAG: acyl carrier protein [Deltaproteobacteria bacterium]|nr:acyl carrier protein [Deltaproteobacteria bacterium]